MVKSSDKRQKIIDTAITAFVKTGVHGTSMHALAKAAGVATGSIYTYFDSKETLIMTAFNTVIEAVDEIIVEGYDNTLSVKARFYFLLEKNIRFYIAQPDKFRFMVIAAHEPVVMKMGQDDDCADSPLGIVLTDGQKSELIKNIPIHALFYQIFGGMEAFLGWLLFNQPEIKDTDITDIIDMAWDAIKLG